LGVTGAELSAKRRLANYLERVRKSAGVPFIAGFGIATPADVKRVCAQADGAVVGSALLKRLAGVSDPVTEAYNYLHSLAAALPKPAKG
ncbi:MAG: tryptophan synthase subunit alpha, partial [Candidatus Neomarinimicrobiota bacterium]